MNKKKLKIIGGFVGVTALVAGAATLTYVFCHKPDVVENPCYRSTHRSDGRPKVAFDTPEKANWQSVKQLVCYGEVCNSYQVGENYYTGHSGKAEIRSINPFD